MPIDSFAEKRPIDSFADKRPVEEIVEEILAENARRRVPLKEVFNHVAGDPLDGGRFECHIPELGRYLPLELREESPFKEILAYPTLQAYLNNNKERTEGETLEAAKRKRILHDFPYWAGEYAYIKRKGGGEDMQFVLNSPQLKLVRTLETMRRRGEAIRLVLLKARQWGGSTCIQLYMAWLQLVHKLGLNSLIIAHQGCGTDEIKDMFDRMLKNYPDDLLYKDYDKARPARAMERVGGAGAAFRVIGRNCKVKIGTAERPDSCRGGDYNLIHCSEVGLWKTTRLRSPEDIHRAASSGVLLAPYTMIAMESTANGTGNFFHREYEAAKNGESQFRALFVAWYEIGQYMVDMNEEDLRDFALRLVEGREAEQTQSSRRQPGKYLWRLWERGATLEGIRWYVEERAKYSDHALMAAEYPSDDIEAFVHSGARVFDRYCVEALRKGCMPPVLQGEIDGDAAYGPGSLRNVRFNADANGGLLIWHDREHGEEMVRDRYLVVVDIGGRAASSDWSVVTVIDRGPMCRGGLPTIAAQWRGHTDFDLLAWRAARIAKYFEDALLVIESNTLETHDMPGSGDAEQAYFLLTQIRASYRNLYARMPSAENVRNGMPVRYGFHTNRATKPMVISTLVQAVREGLYVERDERCLDEYLTYEQAPNGGYGALQGYHDDMLMTRAIGLHIAFYEMRAPYVCARGAGVTGFYRSRER